MKLPVKYSETHWSERAKVRDQYIKDQDSLCYWCGKFIFADPPKEITRIKINWRLFPKNFLKYPIHLQHDHKTDLTEGAVHAYCNAVMWQHHGR